MFLEANCGERAPRQNLRRVSKGFDLAGLDDTSHPRVRRRTRDVEMRPRVRDSPREPRLRPRSAAGLSCLHAGLCIFRLLRSVVTVGRPQSSQLCGVKVIGGNEHGRAETERPEAPRLTRAGRHLPSNREGAPSEETQIMQSVAFQVRDTPRIAPQRRVAHPFPRAQRFTAPRHIRNAPSGRDLTPVPPPASHRRRKRTYPPSRTRRWET